MSDEIRRLNYLVGDFDHPFHPHHGFLKTYKRVSPSPFSQLSSFITCVLIYKYLLKVLKFL